MTNDIKMPGCAYIVIGLVFIIVAIVGIFALLAMLSMWAWGLFMVPVFGLPLLSFQEALGAVFLLFVLRVMFLQPSIKRISK